MSENALQILQENFFFNTKETSEQNPEVRDFFNKVAESINNEVPDKKIEGKFVFIGRTNSIGPAYLMFVLNDEVEKFFDLVRTMRTNRFSWEIGNSDFFVNIRIARVFLPWRSKVIIEIDNEKLLVFKEFIEEYFANSEIESVFSYDQNVSIGSKISNELNNMGA